MGDDVDISTLTMEQYMALIQDNIRSGIAKPKIDGPALRWKNRLSIGLITTWDLLEEERNLKVHEMIIMKDSKIVKAKGGRRSLALKTRNESSDEECLTSGSEDEEYAWRLETSRSSSREEEDSSELKFEVCLILSWIPIV
nr:transposase, Ptta/En/Spm, transposase, Tnp1/En/Spm-like protein [Tanacetum cinerariifolium]